MTGEQQTTWDRRLAAPMFVVTTLYLGIAGVAVHLLSDESGRYNHIAGICGWAILGLTAVYVVELVLHWSTTGQLPRQNLLYGIIPPLRLGAGDHVTGRTIWLPGIGWRQRGEELANEIELKLGYPMIGIALLILPLLGVQFVYAEAVENNRTLGFVVQLAGTFIWLAFAMEFIVMISIVDKKLKFAKEHWLDLAIILLPLIAFLRTARIGRLSRLFRMKQLGKLGKTARVFRLRGLAMRAWRAILILEIVDRLVNRDPNKRLTLLQEQLQEKESEVAELRQEIQALQLAMEQQQSVEKDLSTATSA